VVNQNSQRKHNKLSKHSKANGILMLFVMLWDRWRWWCLYARSRTQSQKERVEKIIKAAIEVDWHTHSW